MTLCLSWRTESLHCGGYTWVIWEESKVHFKLKLFSVHRASLGRDCWETQCAASLHRVGHWIVRGGHVAFKLRDTYDAEIMRGFAITILEVYKRKSPQKCDMCGGWRVLRIPALCPDLWAGANWSLAPALNLHHVKVHWGGWVRGGWYGRGGLVNCLHWSTFCLLTLLCESYMISIWVTRCWTFHWVFKHLRI